MTLLIDSNVMIDFLKDNKPVVNKIDDYIYQEKFQPLSLQFLYMKYLWGL